MRERETMALTSQRKGRIVTPSEFDKAAAYWTSKEDGEKRMPADELRAAINVFLSEHNTCALATGAGGFVRCTPLEYAWRDGALWIFSEGGLKFRGLKDNRHVSVAVFEPYDGFGKLASAQITGTAELVDPSNPEFAEAAASKGIPANALKTLASKLHLIKVTPDRIDYLCSDLKAQGYDSRQHLKYRETIDQVSPHSLELFVMDGCPFCAKVEAFLAENSIDVPERSISSDPDAEKTLIAIGGKRQVPCLFIDGKPLYESGDIIAWLRENEVIRER